LHFFAKLVLAAPARGWPFFPIALLSHVPGCATAGPSAKIDSKTTRKKLYDSVGKATFEGLLACLRRRA